MGRLWLTIKDTLGCKAKGSWGLALHLAARGSTSQKPTSYVNAVLTRILLSKELSDPALESAPWSSKVLGVKPLSRVLMFRVPTCPFQCAYYTGVLHRLDVKSFHVQLTLSRGIAPQYREPIVKTSPLQLQDARYITYLRPRVRRPAPLNL